MKTVPLHGAIAAGRVALVDDGDYDLAMQYHWNVFESPRTGRGGHHGPYAVAGIYHPETRTQTHVYMHKLLTGWPQTDHINHDGLDNRRENLRPATTAQNQHNSRPQPSHSRFKGVTWCTKPGKWNAVIRIDGRSRYLGRFADEKDAALAYDAAARVAFGEYAYLNFPNEFAAATIVDAAERRKARIAARPAPKSNAQRCREYQKHKRQRELDLPHLDYMRYHGFWRTLGQL